MESFKKRNCSNSSKENNVVCIPAGASFEQFLPKNLLYASKVSLETCPYNPSHQVTPSRLRGHIIKCARNHPPLAICYFNATHRMPEDKLEEHVKSCPSRIDVAPLSTLPTEVLKTMSAQIPVPRPKYNPDDDEDWD